MIDLSLSRSSQKEELLSQSTFIQLVYLIINIPSVTHPGQSTVAELKHYKTFH